MEISISSQLTALCIALCLGFLLGILYDLLRPIRRVSGKTGAAIIDVIYSVLSGAALFLFAMGADSGKLGIWELSAAFSGFLIYTYTLSDIFFSAFNALYGFLGAVLKKLSDLMMKVSAYLKKAFKKPTK